MSSLPSGFWVTGMPREPQQQRTARRVDRKQGTKRVRPEFALKAKRMGFDLQIVEVDETEQAVRARFLPTTPQTREACTKAGGDAQGLEVRAIWPPGATAAEATINCIEHGFGLLSAML